jgi:hypothetical protein
VDEGPFLSALTFTPDSVSMNFDAMRHGDLYTFEIAIQQVAEPEGIGLLSLALVSVALLGPRRGFTGIIKLATARLSRAGIK